MIDGDIVVVTFRGRQVTFTKRENRPLEKTWETFWETDGAPLEAFRNDGENTCYVTFRVAGFKRRSWGMSIAEAVAKLDADLTELASWLVPS